MKTANIPSLRVNPELRRAAELALIEGETLSSFVEQSLALNIERRLAQREFVARGLASRDAARATGNYISAAEVISGLQAKLDRAKSRSNRSA